MRSRPKPSLGHGLRLSIQRAPESATTARIEEVGRSSNRGVHLHHFVLCTDLDNDS
jgi:hypothetical protein